MRLLIVMLVGAAVGGLWGLGTMKLGEYVGGLGQASSSRAMFLLNSPEGNAVLEASCDIVVVDGTTMVQCDMLEDLLPGAGEER